MQLKAKSIFLNWVLALVVCFQHFANVETTTFCGGDDGSDASIRFNDCPSDGEVYYVIQVVVKGNTSSSDTIALGLLSPGDTPVVKGYAFQDPKKESGYNAYIARDCIPHEGMDTTVISTSGVYEGTQASKNIMLRLTTPPVSSATSQRWFVTLLSRKAAGFLPVTGRSISCSAKLNPALLTAASADVTCTRTELLGLIGEAVRKTGLGLCAPIRFPDNMERGIVLVPASDDKVGVIVPAVVVPVVVILLFLLLFFIVHSYRMKKKQARMHKFQALSRGQLGGNPQQAHSQGTINVTV